MIEAGTRNIEDDWSIVVDVTDNLSSNISEIACKDMERTLNGLSAYIKATMEVNAVMVRPDYLAGDFDSIDQMLSEIKTGQRSLKHITRVNMPIFLHVFRMMKKVRLPNTENSSMII